MRTQTELMVFVMLAGVVLLTALWTLSRWRTGAREPDPAARCLALLGLAALGGMVGAGRWSWIAEHYGPGFWVPYTTAACLLLVDWLRDRRSRPPR